MNPEQIIHICEVQTLNVYVSAPASCTPPVSAAPVAPVIEAAKKKARQAIPDVDDVIGDFLNSPVPFSPFLDLFVKPSRAVA